MIIYGMYRLIELCDLIEEAETEKRKMLTKQPPGEVQMQPVTVQPDHKSELSDKTEAVVNSELKVQDVYELDVPSERFQVITYHRTLILLQRCLIDTRVL